MQAMKTERFEMKLSKSDKAAFKRAAAAKNVSLAEFILEAAREKVAR